MIYFTLLCYEFHYVLLLIKYILHLSFVWVHVSELFRNYSQTDMDYLHGWDKYCVLIYRIRYIQQIIE